MTGDSASQAERSPTPARSRSAVLALLVAGAVAGFVSADPAATGLAVLALAGVPVVFAVPPRGRPVVGVALVVVALVVTLAGTTADLLTWATAAALVLAGALMAWRGQSWPPPGRRFDGTEGREKTSTDLWRELDRGHDPTEPEEPAS